MTCPPDSGSGAASPAVLDGVIINSDGDDARFERRGVFIPVFPLALMLPVASPGAVDEASSSRTGVTTSAGTVMFRDGSGVGVTGS